MYTYTSINWHNPSFTVKCNRQLRKHTRSYLTGSSIQLHKNQTLHHRYKNLSISPYSLLFAIVNLDKNR